MGGSAGSASATNSDAAGGANSAGAAGGADSAGNKGAAGNARGAGEASRAAGLGDGGAPVVSGEADAPPATPAGATAAVPAGTPVGATAATPAGTPVGATAGTTASAPGAARGANSHIAMSSRVRLARNFSGMLFPGRIKHDQARSMLEKAKEAFFASPEINAKDYLYVEIQQLDSIDRMMLVEKRLVSPDLITGDRPSAVIVSKDEAISVMLNEEDHLRIQCIVPSADIDASYKACCKVDRIFDGSFDIAFDQSLGYLTSCPTNLGTGMRASFMLHLPALVMTGYIKGVLEACGKIGVAVRVISGENSETSGSMFQFSNQGSLGRDEGEIIASVKNAVSQIVGHESRLRQELAHKSPVQFQDRVYRAYGILQSARVLTSEEFMRLWSDVRLGVDMGTIRDISIKRLDQLLTLVQPAYIQKMFGRMLNSEERDVHRAALVREQTKDAAKA
ncbi:MAG: protein arginine kinase [Clostridiales bacterium]|nr:protein arginine kinase [Clostridiales bacterium]